MDKDSFSVLTNRNSANVGAVVLETIPVTVKDSSSSTNTVTSREELTSVPRRVFTSKNRGASKSSVGTRSGITSV